MTLLMFLGGLVLLIVGAEVLVRGASRLAAALGVSPLIIGLTVVAFGTSSPELAVSVGAATSGQAGLVVGNVVGSNIFNVLFILGLSAIITPLVVAQRLVRLDVPLMIAVSALVWGLAADGDLARWEGGLLVAGLVAYLGLLLVLGRRESAAVAEQYEQRFGEAETPATREEPAPPGAGRYAVDAVMVIAGLGLLILGSRWLVDAATVLARALGVSELLIGLTVVAAGTSLPEVVTSVIASVRGERDIAVGNVVGSNLFNLLGVLGVAGLLAPAAIPVSTAAVGFDIPVMTAVALACLPVFFTGGVIARWEGAVFLGYYLAYTLYLALGATHHDALPLFSAAMLYFVLPLTVLTLGVVTLRAVRRR